MNRLGILLLLVLGAIASLASAASAPTFCKCTCFTNSTIIEIKARSAGKVSGATGSSGSSSGSAKLVTSPPDGNSSTDGDEDTDTDTSSSSSSPPSPPQASLSKRAQVSASCSQCNKAFCLGQSLPICKDATEKDVVTMCFQRDSRKDQIIVWGFILGTAGLLGWAALQKAIEVREGGGLVNGVGIGGSDGAALGRREGVLPIGRGGMGPSGSDAGRGVYAAVAGRSRESTTATGR